LTVGFASLYPPYKLALLLRLRREKQRIALALAGLGGFLGLDYVSTRGTTLERSITDRIIM
jgi:hypothetical protein